uniref:Protein WVD2-like 7 n=1 Tax=Noccaea caerulescens TaxID=107243 RepID=A0A1J3E7R9_NOCCA
MGDMQVGVANIDDKGFYGLMEDKPVKAVASPNPSLQVSVSFGRFENDSLSWEKFSAFSPNKYLEEVGKCATPGSVAQKKAYFEAHYKKIAERKAEIMDQEKEMDKNASFRSIVTDQEGENGGESSEQLGCEEDKHVTDIAAEEVKEVSVEETIIVKECQSSVDEFKEEVKNSVDSPKLEKSQEVAVMEEKPEVVVHVQEKPEEVLEVREKILSNETPRKEIRKEKTQKLTKKDGNVGINRTRISPKPNQVTAKHNKIVTSRKTPPSKEIKNMMKATKKPVAAAAAPISKASPRLSTTPRVYKPASQTTLLSTSHSSVKKETNVSSSLRNKQTAPKSLHNSMNLGPSASSDPTSLASTRKSLIMERMGDKDIVKRAFKSFQKSFDFDGETTAPKQNPAKATSIPSLATRPKENGRPTKASSMEKRSNITAQKQHKEQAKTGERPVEKTGLQKSPMAGVIDTKPRRETLNPKSKPVQGSLQVRTLPKAGPVPTLKN